MAGIDPSALAAFRAGMRKRYTDEEIVAQISACAERLGRSPTMREFAADPETTVHPQTAVERFGGWNEAKRRAGLAPRRFATREDLLLQLRALGDELGRAPTGKDLDARRGTMPSKSLYWHVFGSLTKALRAAGFDVPTGEERRERALAEGTRLARTLGRLPSFSDWGEARRRDAGMLSEWQVYRLFAPGGGWSALQFLVRERLVAEGTDVGGDGVIRGATGPSRRWPRARRGGRGRTGARRARGRGGAAAP